MLLKKFAEYLKSQPEAGMFHVVRQQGPYGDDDSASLSQAEPTVSSARVVEGDGTMRTSSVGAPVKPRFCYFLDGTQRTHVPCYFSMLPLVYGFIGAVIRRRGDDRLMCTFIKESRENLYYPTTHASCEGMRSSGIDIRDVDEWAKGKLDPASAHPAQIKLAAQQAISNDRAKLEYQLAETWTERCSPDEWMLWDGSITGSVKTREHPRIVGVVKSHQTQYFETMDQMKVLSLKVGERSSVFEPKGREWSPVYSWYLRLHPNAGRDVYFGLIRVEAAARPEMVEMADEISQWLLGERAPLALPDGRWDRMIYPIRDCEQYLKSIAPSRVMIESALAGIG